MFNARLGRSSEICPERIDEDVVVLFRLIMEIVSADAEIERAAEIRSQPEFLAQLPSMFFRQILPNDTVAATQLRIAEYCQPDGILPVPAAGSG